MSPREERVRVAVRRHLRAALLVLALGAMGGALGILGDEARLWVKARLAGVLIQRAFAAHLEDGTPHRPWRWADTHPVALLSVTRLGVRRVVLDGASGESMAFALGHVHGTGAPNGPGNCVLAGHRDSHAAFLAELRVGDEVRLRSAGSEEVYVVEALRVVEDSAVDVLGSSPAPRLSLVTCWPFGDRTPSSRRYVITCSPAPRLAHAPPHPG